MGKQKHDGSSPWIQGKHFGQQAACRCHGIIPARGGNTSKTSGAECDTGSSPQTEKRQIIKLGIIPAQTGKTGCIWSWASSRWDHPRIDGGREAVVFKRHLNAGHPRAYGGKAIEAQSNVSMSGSGSFPKSRGKRQQAGAEGGATGLSPCSGGIASHLTVAGLYWGSSPCTRGKLQNEIKDERGSRIIPVSTGEYRPLVSASDHPWVGSSPRTRGEPSGQLRAPRIIPEATGGTQVDQRRRVIGSTPARTGETRRRRTCSSGWTDHSREYGKTPLLSEI